MCILVQEKKTTITSTPTSPPIPPSCASQPCGTSGSPCKSCCSHECIVTQSKSECDAQGGIWCGSSPVPNNCKNCGTTGECPYCCRAEKCDTQTESECETQGGIWCGSPTPTTCIIPTDTFSKNYFTGFNGTDLPACVEGKPMQSGESCAVACIPTYSPSDSNTPFEVCNYMCGKYTCGPNGTLNSDPLTCNPGGYGTACQHNNTCNDGIGKAGIGQGRCGWWGGTDNTKHGHNYPDPDDHKITMRCCGVNADYSTDDEEDGNGYCTNLSGFSQCDLKAEHKCKNGCIQTKASTMVGCCGTNSSVGDKIPEWNTPFCWD